MHVNLPSLPSPTPPPPPPQKCQIRILCQFVKKIRPPPPEKKLDSLSKNLPTTNPPTTQTTHTSPTPRPIIFLIWIICQLDSVLVYFFYKLTKNPNLKKSFFSTFFFGGGGGGGACGGGRGNEHYVQMF